MSQEPVSPQTKVSGERISLAGLWSWRQRNSAAEGGIVCVCALVHAQKRMDGDWRGVVLKERKGLFMVQLVLPKG